MERKDKVALSVVAFMGIFSAALGFAAEVTRIKPSQLRRTEDEKCVYSSSNRASYFEAFASITLLVAQIFIVLLTRGYPCCRKGTHPTLVALACLVVSWGTFGIVQLLYLVNLSLFSQCAIVKPGVYAAAATLSFASVIHGIAYSYIILKEDEEDNGFDQREISVGQLRFPSVGTQI